MNNDELIACKYLKKIYNEPNISFEPNGYKKYPDFICDNCNEYEVTGLYPVDSGKTDIQVEKPILNNIERLVEKYNCEEYGYYLDITIDGLNQPCKKSIEKWFRNNNDFVKNTTLSTGCLTIELFKQDCYKEKYVIGTINYLNGSPWLIPAHIEAIDHCINRKKDKMSKGSTLILVNHVSPEIVYDIFQNIGNIEFGVVMIDVHSKKQHEWPNKANSANAKSRAAE